VGAFTSDVLYEWNELCHDFSVRLGRMMDGEDWKDLPTDVFDKLIDAGNAFAKASEAIERHLSDHERFQSKH